ncbi:Type I secretion system membrane fusion protein PrsE [Pannonibacter phragmitetus]|uniref:Membrane fusion protein (MFP) family protein n=1 Tax=Pannonibacter phragmitetus TaxID=121719 RepID=A0A378ZPN5_9HYPH|nr:HlyD family type I secretion periplasmic adaptor subunit [Pannonibacter phragmitetus]SUA99216.1 Type I secretion system membrane fusion protein PrsE [Pannonibacter phragmitetus]
MNVVPLSAAAVDQQLANSVTKHFWGLLSLAALVLGGLGVGMAFATISGAVVASGTVVVETNVKQVQHREGGIVREIYVRNGDHVEAGQQLVRLDDTVTKANLAVVSTQLLDLYAQEARLLAERDGAETITFSTRASAIGGREEIKLTQEGQINLLNARRASLGGRKDQLAEQITQFERQIDGLDAQQIAKEAEIALIDTELADLTGLLEKGLVSKPRVIALRRERTRLEGERGELISRIAQVREGISERRIQILQLDDEMQASVLEQLQDVRLRIAGLEEQKIAAEDELQRIVLLAPQSGFVHQLAVHTIGGVIAPGEVIMLIVPQEDLLVIEAQVQPKDISQITAGQTARIKFPSFDQRTTPDLTASVQTISADLQRDDVTGHAFYAVRLAIPDSDLTKLDGKRLVPGMPAETFVETGDRTILSYLMKPLYDQISHAMRER